MIPETLKPLLINLGAKLRHMMAGFCFIWLIPLSFAQSQLSHIRLGGF